MKPTKRQLANRAKWFAALRSGEYQQGKGYLCSEGNYCCLGVDAKVGRNLSRERIAPNGLRQRFEKVSDSGSMVSTQWTANRHGITGYQASELIGKAATMNDTGGKSFKQIARSLEAMFAKYDRANARKSHAN